MQYFGEKTDKYLAAWLLPRTSISMHQNDLDRFDCFVHALLTFGETTFRSEDFSDSLSRAMRKNKKLANSQVEDLVSQLLNRAWVIVDYRRATAVWPKPDVETMNLTLK